MPQLFLDYSSNIIEKTDLRNLLNQCHHILAETLPTDLSTCKSRAVEQDCYMVGDGKVENAFVHCRLQVMPGRSEDVLKKLGSLLMNLFSGYFEQSLKQRKLQITLEILELSPHYFKVASAN